MGGMGQHFGIQQSTNSLGYVLQARISVHSLSPVSPGPMGNTNRFWLRNHCHETFDPLALLSHISVSQLQNSFHGHRRSQRRSVYRPYVFRYLRLYPRKLLLGQIDPWRRALHQHKYSRVRYYRCRFRYRYQYLAVAASLSLGSANETATEACSHGDFPPRRTVSELLFS